MQFTTLLVLALAASTNLVAAYPVPMTPAELEAQKKAESKSVGKKVTDAAASGAQMVIDAGASYPGKLA